MMANFWDDDVPVGAKPAGPAAPAPNFWDNDTPVGNPTSASVSPANIASDIAKGGGVGVGEGIISLLGMPGDIEALGKRGADWVAHKLAPQSGMGASPPGSGDNLVPSPFSGDISTMPIKNAGDVLKALAVLQDGNQPLPTSEGIQKAVEQVTGPFYQPKTGPGRFANEVGQIVPSAALGTELPTLAGDGVLSAAKAAGAYGAKVLIPATVAAGGGELADSVGLPKWAGQTAGFIAAKAPGLLLKNPEQMIKDRLGDVSGADIDAARDLQAKGQAVGVPLMGQESFNNLGLTQLAGDVAASPTGAPIINKALTARTPQIQAARDNMLNAIAPNVEPQATGDMVQQAADQRLRDLAEMRTDAASPSYKASATQIIPDTESQRIEQAARDAAIQAGAGTTARTRLIALADAIRENAGNVGQLDSTRRTFRDNLTNMALPDAADSTTHHFMKPILDDLRDTMATHSPEYAEGLKRYQDASKIVDVVNDSPVGQVLAKNSNPVSVTNTFAPTGMGPGEVRGTLNELALANQWAPQQVTRLVARNESNVPATPTAAMKIANALMVKPDTAENFQAMLKGSEFANGQMPGTISGPVNDTLGVFDATRRAPTVGSQTAGRGATNAAAGASKLGSFMQTSITDPLGHLGDWLKYNAQRKTYKELAQALTDHNSVDQLLDLARRQGVTPGLRLLGSAATVPNVAQPNAQ